MPSHSHPPVRQLPSELRQGVIRRVIQICFMLLMTGGILFAAAGTLAWSYAWWVLGVYFAALLVAMALLVPRFPELVAERAKPAPADTLGWDKKLAPLYILLSTFGVPLAAGLDYRLAGTAPMPGWIPILGLVAIPFSYGLVVWSMAANAHFVGNVRIQVDGTHQVASGGPYRLVRHPGYLGMTCQSVAMSLALSSLWALGAAGVAFIILVIRTALEDAALRQQLPGYQEYADEVRYRLFPGIW